MTRGNQRELARQKNAKKNNDHTKGKRNEDGLSAAARKQRDAEIMQQKQKKANEKDSLEFLEQYIAHTLQSLHQQKKLRLIILTEMLLIVLGCLIVCWWETELMIARAF
uniref:Small EDRK-rich factor 2 n=1 Tax=Cyprinus carpio TaxID=7962 RepID=A0A8C2IH24_CYPCA